MRLSLLVLFVPMTAIAAPAPSFEVIDHGDTVEVIAHEITALQLEVTSVRSRLEVAIVGRPTAKRDQPVDPTIKLIELDGSSPRRLSIKTGFEYGAMSALADRATATQVGADLHVTFPRQLPAPIAATSASAVIAPLAPTTTAPIVSVALAPEPTTAPALATAPASSTTVATGVPAHPTTVATPPFLPVTHAATTAPPAHPTTAAAPSDLWSRFSVYAAIGLAAIGCVGWFIRRRRGAPSVASTIDIIAQRSLGGKARVMWLSVGPRELIVAVTPQQIRVLGQWRAGEAVPAAARAHIDEPVAAPLPLAPPSRSTAAVAGLLRLRERSTPTLARDIATEDPEADSLWAREIIAATGASR